MYRHYESFTEKETPKTTPHIIEYPGLLDTAQLSAARLIDVPGSLQKNSFAEVLADIDEEDREQVLRDVGAGFDDALLNFVTATLIGRRNQEVIILAEESEGINGYLPWEPKLKERVELLKRANVLHIYDLRVERYSSKAQTVEELTAQAQTVALDAEHV